MEEWFCNDTFGTMLLCGEPGHGKTSLCNKAMVDYYRGDFLRDNEKINIKKNAKNVLAISLNTGDNRRIIKDGMVNLEEALAWGDNRQHIFTFEDCHGALLFMDGFDEFIDEAKGTNIKDIVTFMKIINGIADEYDVHIVVLSRTIAVDNYLSNPAIINKSFKLLPITERQQDMWLVNHSEYNDYREDFSKIRNDNDMRILLGIPFLFRLIVHNRFDKVSSNIVQLYNSLFYHLMDKRNICGEDFESVNNGLRNLAYDIYCTDTDTAVLAKDKKDDRWIIAFYIKQFEKGRIGFFHRSFYQYFLADFIYWTVKSS